LKQPCFLVVESDDDERRRISTWLEDEGFTDVMFCPGPGAPDYTCVGGRGASCPLPNAADVVVVDLRLGSDEMLTGTPGWQLMLYYIELGKKVVAISGHEDSVRPRSDDQVRVVGRPLERHEFLSAMRSSGLGLGRRELIRKGGEDDHLIADR
jgi:hypothetical protein